MTKLSVNLNKVALLRNSRTISIPSVLKAANIAILAGADGITVHPRPDERHIRVSDVFDLYNNINVEFNIEGNPFPNFMDMVLKIKPAQCTLVPDSPTAFTSDHGWNLFETDANWLKSIISKLQSVGTRVSLFLDPDVEQVAKAKEFSTDRIELYTEPYARAYTLWHKLSLDTNASEEDKLQAKSYLDSIWQKYHLAAVSAQEYGIGVNAGHDLNLDNLGYFVSIPNILEVSIGHALISDALEIGLAQAVKEYKAILSKAN